MSRSRTTRPPPPRQAKAGELPKLYDNQEDEASRTDQTGAMPISTRTGDRPRLTVMTGMRSGFIVKLHGELIIGRSSESTLVLMDPGVSRRHARIGVTKRGHFVEDLGSTNGTLVNGVAVERTDLVAGDRIQIGPEVVVQFAMLDETEDRLAEKLYEASTRDPLTGMLNRRAFLDRLEPEVAYALRHKTSLSILLIDVDHFKKTNDTYGHAAGDAVLRALAKVLATAVRPEDGLCRYGGEEFALFARGVNLALAQTLAERLRTSIAASKIVVGEKTLKITVSIGVADLFERTDMGTEQVIALADSRLYRAKEGGRNRVVAEG